jgi:proteasome beta subunit
MGNDELKTGTTTIGIVYKDGVVMATEHRATMGNIIAHKDVRKLFKIDDNIGLTVAGLVGDAQVLARYIKAEVELYKLKKGTPMTVKAAATLLSNIMRGGGGAYGYYYVGLIMGGQDAEGGHVYALDAAGGNIRDEYVSIGSGSVFAYGVLEDHFKMGMTKDETIDLAIRALNAAQRRDSASGDGYAVAVIDKAGFKELSADESLERAHKMKLNVGYVPKLQ